MLALRLNVSTLRLKLATHPQVIVTLYASLLILPLLGSARTFTYHESFTAQGAREMLATGDWLIPRVAGRPWLEKPPLPQWAAAVSGVIFGRVDEFTSRLPAALAALAGLLAITGLIQRLRGANAAMLTGLFLITMTSIITYARLAEPDIFLWAIVTGAIAIFARRMLDPAAPTKWWASSLAFFVLLGLTQTSKGPIFGAVMVLAPCGAWLVLHRFRDAKWCLSPFSWIVGLALALAWPAAVLLSHPEALELWKYHTLGRLDANVAYNAKPWWYYFTTLPWQAAPALLVALPALTRSLKSAWNEASLDRFLWLWVISQFAALSVASGKHHHYLIYALPPFAIWAAAGLVWYRDLFNRLWQSSTYRVVSTCLWLAALGAACVFVERRQIMVWWEAFAVGGGVLVGLIMTLQASFKKNDTLAGMMLAITLGGVVLYTNTVWLTRTDLYKPDGELAHRLEQASSPDEVILVYNMEPARMLLDMDRKIVWIKDDPEALRRAVAERPGSMILTAVFYLDEVRALTPFVEVDRTPHPKWPGRTLSHMVAVRATP